jgi:cell division septation protein DedD
MLSIRIAVLATAPTILFGCADGSRPTPVVLAAESMTRLEPGEVHQLYSGKTWLWDHGAAYLAPNSTFEAWSGADEQARTYAQGRWYATDTGEMCYQAMWYVQNKGTEEKACFSHAKLGDTIYQKKVPDGEWYVFKRDAATLSESISRFVAGNQVSSEVAILSGGGSEPSPGDVGELGRAPTASRSVVAPPIAEAPLVPRAEVSNDDASAVAAEPHAPDGARDRPPNTATALGGDPLASGGDRADLVPSAAPLPVDPGPAGSSPETTIRTVKEPTTPSRPATIGAPEPSAATAELTAAPPARPAEAPSAGRFVVYFFSVRPSARVVSEWRRLTERHPALAGLELQTPRSIDVPGTSTLYAVEAGAFATRAEAQAICDQLRPRGQRCRVLAR